MNICTNLALLLFCHISKLLSFEGDYCTLFETNDKGRCMSIHQCEYGKMLLKQNKRPQLCGFNKIVPLVCCLASQKLRAYEAGELSRKMCNQFYDLRIQPQAATLGRKAKSKEFPHMAAVGYSENAKKIVWLCGGTLISHYFILSAAHCAESRTHGLAEWVRLGVLDLINTTEDASPQNIKITKILVHPSYRLSSHYHDIALFKTEMRIYFGLYVKPACLQTEKDLPVNTLEATGWGQLVYFGERSSHLMKAELKIVKHATCAKRYTNGFTRKLKDGILDKYQMCAGDSQGRDTCPGDSGGPLQYVVKGSGRFVQRYIVAGIISFGKGCGGKNSVGVYTRVSAYVGWIENIVWPEEEEEY